jgi:hypothetical protein
MTPAGRIGAVTARLLGAVLLVAAYAKAIDPGAFALQIRDLLPLSPGLAQAVAIAGIGAEGALGAALAAGWRHRAVLLATTATFVAFLVIVVREWWYPNAAATGCGCFGQLLQRTPAQAVVEDLVFVGMSGLAWLGRPPAVAAVARGPILATGVGLLASVALALAAPSLPLDDHATALSPGATVGAAHLAELIPAVQTGRHLVVLLDRAAPNAPDLVTRLHRLIPPATSRTPVWGLADDDPNLAAAFLWSAGPTFEIRSAAPRMLRTMYRTLPRTALVDGGRVLQTWNGLPADDVLAALARGELP